MNKLILLIISFVLVVNINFAQISKGGKPYSLTHNLNEVLKVKTISAVSEIWKTEASKNSSNNGTLEAVAKIFDTNLSLNNSGSWTVLKNGDRVWRLKITATDAIGIDAYFKDFHLAEKTKLFIYNEDYSQIIGSFTDENNELNKLFATEIIFGNTLILEFYEPREQQDLSSFTIEGIGSFYKDVYFYKASGFNGSEDCEININCSPEGNNWQDQKKGVARIKVKQGSSIGWCSGTLVNNTNLDCKPYFLTAYHCGDASSSSDFDQWVFYFNYEFNGCSDASEPTPNTMSGSSKIARSNDLNSSSTSSDFLLLELNQVVPQNYNVYYNGWDKANTAPSSGVSIHHPAGDVKKISTYNASLGTVGVSWTGSGYGITSGSTHWNVLWASTSNGLGVTEGGSSGSPIFNTNGNVIGTLSGGGSACVAGGAGAGTGPDRKDQYGKMSYHWTSNSTSQSRQLKPWLDPTNSGVNSLEGTYDPCTAITSIDAAITQILSPKGDLCNESYTPKFILKNNGSVLLTNVTVSYSINSGTPVTQVWSGGLTSGNTEVVTLAAGSTANSSNTFTITLSNPNGLSDDNNANNSLNLTFNTNVKKPLPLIETFEIGNFNDLDYIIENPDNEKTWENATNIGSYGTTDNCLYIDNWDYEAQNQFDWFVTKAYDLSDSINDELYFDLAYTYYHQTNGTNVSYDSLGIAYSPDCGDNFYWLWKDGGESLATRANGLGIEFIPENDDWESKVIDLELIKGRPSIMFAFIAINGYGNNMYIDNIGVGKTLLGVNDKLSEIDNVLIFPNPVNDFLSIDVENVNNESYNVEIFNTLGQQLLIINSLDVKEQIDVSKFQKGLYYIKVSSFENKGLKSTTVKFIKE